MLQAGNAPHLTPAVFTAELACCTLFSHQQLKTANNRATLNCYISTADSDTKTA